MYGYSSVGRFDVFFRNQLLVFQQHQDESLYDSWTRFKDIIQKVPNHGLTEGDLRKFSDIGAWYAIEDYAKYDKNYSNPISAISDETIANLNAQIVRDDMVREYTPPVTYPEEVEKTLGIPVELEPLNETKLEEVGLHFNHNTPFSSREVPSFDGPEPQPLFNSPSLDGMFDNDWGLESMEVSPLGEELSLFDRPNEVERGRILEAHHLESILQQQISQYMAPSHHDGTSIEH
ncbi:hypothetical protein Tco_0146177 [Tanacetum coccineum]